MEKVLALRRRDVPLGAEVYVNGFTPDPLPFLSLISRPGIAQFYDRAEIEDNELLKQIIPFFVVCQGSRVLVNQRSSSSGDARLRGTLSLIIGGHVNDCDAPPVTHYAPPLHAFDTLASIITGARRELKEELWIMGDTSGARATIAGVVNEEDTPAGRTHIGVVISLNVPPSCRITKRCESMSYVQLIKRQDLCGKTSHPGLTSRLETWSQIVAAQLDRLAEKKENHPLLTFYL